MGLPESPDSSCSSPSRVPLDTSYVLVAHSDKQTDTQMSHELVAEWGINSRSSKFWFGTLSTAPEVSTFFQIPRNKGMGCQLGIFLLQGQYPNLNEWIQKKDFKGSCHLIFKRLAAPKPGWILGLKQRYKETDFFFFFSSFHLSCLFSLPYSRVGCPRWSAMRIPDVHPTSLPALVEKQILFPSNWNTSPGAAFHWL